MIATRIMLLALATIAATAAAPIPAPSNWNFDRPQSNTNGTFNGNSTVATSNQNGAKNTDQLNMADTNDYHPSAVASTNNAISSALNYPSAVMLQTMGSMQQSQNQADVAMSKDKTHAAEHMVDAMAGASQSAAGGGNGFEKRAAPFLRKRLGPIAAAGEVLAPEAIEAVEGGAAGGGGGLGNIFQGMMNMGGGGLMGGGGGSSSSGNDNGNDSGSNGSNPNQSSGGDSGLGGLMPKVHVGSTNTSSSNQAALANQNSASNVNSAESGRKITMKRSLHSL